MFLLNRADPTLLLAMAIAFVIAVVTSLSQVFAVYKYRSKIKDEIDE